MDLALKIKNRSASSEEIDEYADKLIDDLLTLPTSPTSPIIDCYSNYSVIPKDISTSSKIKHSKESMNFEL